MTLNQIMVKMGNACTCCRTLYRSPNMKSAVSSSSSGSERVSVSGVPSGSKYDLEETKTNSRMSCTSDDSCAINELLEGRMDLNVTLPNSANPVVINVERRTPMLDLLVNISTQYRFNAANYTINAADHEFKANTPIGSLDCNQISIISKNSRSSSLKSIAPSAIPFKTTFRLQVNLPRNQLMVMRVTPNATIAAIKQLICIEKELDPNKYQLVRFSGQSEGPHILDVNKTLAFYTLNELTLISTKNLTQLELQYATSGASQVDMSPSRANSMVDSVIKKSVNSLIVSQSNPDFSTIDEKAELNHTNVKQQKKRPAPPPPKSSSATLPNKSFSLQIIPNRNENESIESIKNDSNLKFDEKVSETPQTTDESKPVLKVPKSVTHVRQNSGSDSSGYHESVLSSDSPESSSATTLNKSSSMTESSDKNNSKQTNNVLNQKSVTKKRRAPPPPTNYSTQDTGAQQVKSINGHKHNVNDMIDESKVVLECMSDVSLPLSTSSSSSGTASDINNRSLSPIVITQTNGSSTPIQSVTFKDNSLDYESTQCSSPSDTAIDSQTKQSIERPVICVQNNTDSNVEQLDTNSENFQQLDETESSVEQIRQKSPELDIRDQSIDLKVETFDEKQTSNGFKDCKESENESISESESLPNTEVSCTAPALTVSHETELCGHDCSEQVAETKIDNIVDNKEPDLKQDINDKSDDNQTNEFVIDPKTNNIETESEEMPIPVPPPSPFQNRNNEEHIESPIESPIEGQPIVEQLESNSETISEALSDDNNTSKQQTIENCDNFVTKEDPIESTIQTKQTNVCNQIETQKTITKLIVSDEDTLNKEIEVTLQSLNDELDRLDSSDPLDSFTDSIDETKSVQNYNQINSVLNNENKSEKNSNIESINTNVSLEVKQINNNNNLGNNIEELKSIFERKESLTPSPTPRVMSPIKESVQENITYSKNVLPITTTNGKTTLFINNSQSPTPTHRSFSPSISSSSPSPTNEDKLSITDEVRHLCRPRVRLTNFSIGSFKKEVDIFESTPTTVPMTAPVKSTTKPFETFPSTKKEEKSRQTINASKSKIEITSNSMTATTTTTIPKSTTPVIQTLITSAPKISRIQSWSGQKSVCLQEKNIKPPLKTNERYVSQISITRDINDSKKVNQNSDKESNEELMSPHLVVKSMTTKIDNHVKSRTPSPNHLNSNPNPKQVFPKIDSNKEKISITIKPGLESIIGSNCVRNDSQNTQNTQNRNNLMNEIKRLQQNGGQQKLIKAKTDCQESVRVGTPSPVPITVPPPVPPSVMPSVPPPIPPPEPQKIGSVPTKNSSKNKINTKIFHTKGWNSERVVRSGEVPKVKHVEPPTANVRDQLLNDIKNFGGKNSLKKVSNNSSWKLEVNPLKT